MPKDEKADEKGEKEDEKGEKGEKGEGKWKRDPLGGIFFGIALIVVGSIYLARTYLPSEPWWAWALIGIGVVFFLDAAVHSLKPEWRRPIVGKVTNGIIFVAVGLFFLGETEQLLSTLLIIMGAILIIYYIRKAYSA
jgi:hypothetical protein